MKVCKDRKGKQEVQDKWKERNDKEDRICRKDRNDKEDRICRKDRNDKEDRICRKDRIDKEDRKVRKEKSPGNKILGNEGKTRKIEKRVKAGKI